MLGTYVNSLAIVIGTIFGLIFKRSSNNKLTKSLFDVIAIIVIVIGIDNSLRMVDPISVVLSLVFGVIIGELLRLDYWVDSISKFTNKNNLENKLFIAFVDATLIFCVGSMAIYGSIQSGLMNDHNTLFIKSILDGFTSMVLASSLGVGVIFSSIAVLLYQGTITLLSSFVSTFITDSFVNNLSGVGGIILIAVGLNMLKLYSFRIINYLPSFLVLVIIYIFSLIV